MQVHRTGKALSRQHDRSRCLQWWLHQLLQHLQKRGTRLRTHPHLVQLVLLSGPAPHSERPRPGHIRQISSRRLCLIPPQTLCSNQDRGKTHYWSPICEWLCPHDTQGKSLAVYCRLLCRSIKALWTDHQPGVNGGTTPNSPEHKHCSQPNITIEGVQQKCVESFKYLGSTVSTDGSLDSEIWSRIHKVSQALGRLKVKVLQQKGITLSTKLNVYRAVAVFTLLYGSK